MFEYHVENGGAVITAADGESEYLIVPKQLDGYPVTAVGERAFYGQKQPKKNCASGYGDGYRALCFCGMQTASACDDAKASDIHR